MKRKRMFRLTAVFLAMVMCVTAFSVPALASGGEDTAEVTGGKEWTGRRRPSEPLYPAQMKYRYEKILNGKEPEHVNC